MKQKRISKNFNLIGKWKNKGIVLASSSPRRIELLKKYNIKFKIIKHKINEKKIMGFIRSKDPRNIAQAIAFEKAKSVARGIKSGIVLGADTIVVARGKIIGKPSSIKDAIRILKFLSGTTHRVITALVFIDAGNGRTLITHEESFVTFKELDLKKIKDYIERNHVLDKAGAYAIQEGADPFIKNIKGSYYNIVGLPIEKVKEILRNWEKL